MTLAGTSMCGPLLLQLGRSTEYGKNTCRVTFDSPVLLPVLGDAGVVPRSYSAVSGVVHVGERVTSGHYRAILLQGSQWYFADDATHAARTSMSQQIKSNVYMIWLQPTTAADPGASLQ